MLVQMASKDEKDPPLLANEEMMEKAGLEDKLVPEAHLVLQDPKVPRVSQEETFRERKENLACLASTENSEKRVNKVNWVKPETRVCLELAIISLALLDPMVFLGCLVLWETLDGTDLSDSKETKASGVKIAEFALLDHGELKVMVEISDAPAGMVSMETEVYLDREVSRELPENLE